MMTGGPTGIGIGIAQGVMRTTMVVPAEVVAADPTVTDLMVTGRAVTAIHLKLVMHYLPSRSIMSLLQPHLESKNVLTKPEKSNSCWLRSSSRRHLQELNQRRYKPSRLPQCRRCHRIHSTLLLRLYNSLHLSIVVPRQPPLASPRCLIPVSPKADYRLLRPIP